MQPRVSTTRLIGSSLLGVLAAAAAVLAILMFFGAWVTGTQVTNWFGDVGTIAIITVAVLMLGYSVLAGFAALEEWRGRPIGRMLGLVVAIVAVLAAATALLVGNVAESAALLYVAIGLGVLTAIPLVIPESETAG